MGNGQPVIYKIMYFNCDHFPKLETKQEVKIAAKVLFGIGAFFGIALRFNGESKGIILTIVLGGAAMLLFAAGAYTITRAECSIR
ncbi:hypothetical protein BH10ACI1_BH10ACI1_31780 [soil metagenome]